MADILPPPGPERRDPSALVDGCPNCVVNVEAPFGWDWVDDHWECSYSCLDCGHSWTTHWRP